jgi:hypothetical protein
MNSYKNIIICIVDDGSSCIDEYQYIIEKYAGDKRIIYYRMEINCGVNIARNIALDILIKKYFCDYITFLDDDDTFLQTAFADVYKIIKETTKPWIVTLCENQDNKLITKAKFYGDMSYVNYLAYIDLQGDASHFISSEIIEDIRFATEIKQGEEWTFFIQLSKKSDMYINNRVTKIIKYLPGGLTDVLDTRDKKEKRNTQQMLDKLYLYPLGYTRKSLRRLYLKGMIKNSIFKSRYFSTSKFILRYMLGI